MNISSFDLNLLRVLDALLAEGSTVKAADRIGLSQPAVSAALGRLRHALNDPLFIRQGQRLIPTDFARSLALPLHAALQGIGDLLAGPARFDPASAQASFKLSGSDFFAEMLMPDLAALLSVRAPGLRAQLVDLVPDNYIETLDSRVVDLALVPDTVFPDWVDHRPVFHSPFVVIARASNSRLARVGLDPGAVIPIDLFCDMGHVLFSPQGNLRAMGDAALARIGRERRVVMTLPVFSGVCRAVSKSENIALIPRQLATRLAADLDLSIYLAPMPIAQARISMIWHKRATGNPAQAWFRDLIADLLLPLNPADTPLTG